MSACGIGSRLALYPRTSAVLLGLSNIKQNQTVTLFVSLVRQTSCTKRQPPTSPSPLMIRGIDVSAVSVRLYAIRGLRVLLEAREARERALATGMDAVLQDLRSRTAGSDDSAFAQNIEVAGGSA